MPTGTFKFYREQQLLLQDISFRYILPLSFFLTEEREMKKTATTQYAVLGALSVFPMSGYDIKKWVSDTTGTFWSESLGQIYPTLAYLLRESFIKIYSEKEEGGRSKRIYRITSKGQKHLAEWLKLSAKAPVERNEFIFKMFYGKNLSKEDCLKHLYRQKQYIQDAYVKFKGIEKHIKEEHKDMPDRFYWLLTLKSAFLHCEAEVAWCDEAIKCMQEERKITRKQSTQQKNEAFKQKKYQLKQEKKKQKHKGH